MLVLSRKTDEGIVIADEVEIIVLEIRGGRVRLGFRGPEEISIVRSELASSNAVNPRTRRLSEEVCIS